MSSNCLVFHTSGGISSSSAAFLFLIFPRTELSSSLANGPSLMSNYLLIILVIGSFVTFGGFPCRFSKCCFHSFILSCWFAAFNFALAGLQLSILLWLCSSFYSLRLLFPRVQIFCMRKIVIIITKYLQMYQLLASDNPQKGCPWCNGYRLRKWTRRHEFKSLTRLIAFHIVLIPLGRVWIQLFSLQLWVNSRADWVLQPWRTFYPLCFKNW